MPYIKLDVKIVKVIKFSKIFFEKFFYIKVNRKSLPSFLSF